MLKDFLVQNVYALDPTSGPITGTVFGEDLTIGGLFTWVTNIIIIIGLGLVLVFLALGFIKFTLSQGDKVATETAQKWVTYAVLGGVGLFAVFAIKSVILSLVGATEDPLADE